MATSPGAMSSALKRKLQREGVDADKLDREDAAKLARRVPSLAPRVEGRIDARQEWKPLLCGVSGKREDCGRSAGVVLDGLVVELVTRALGTGVLGKVGNTYEAPEVARRIGLCAAHFAAFRPGVALPSLGWGERIEEAPAAVRLSRELAAASGGEKAREDATDRDGAGDATGPGWAGGRRVGRRRAAGDAAAVASGAELPARAYVERRGFVEELNGSGMLHGADPGRCTRLRSCQRRKDRRLLRAAFDAWPVSKRCACAVW